MPTNGFRARRSPYAAGLAILAACSDYEVQGGADVGAHTGPDIVVDPPTVDFGALAPGAVGTRTVRIANRGGEALDVSRILLGPNLAFALPDPSVAHVIEPGASVLQEVRYTATNASDASWLRVVSDDPDRPEVDVALVGAALLPQLTIEPDPLSFGEVLCGETGTVALRNTGGAPLTIDGVLVNGAAFALPAEPPLPQVVTPGGALMLDVAFTPGPGAVDHQGAVVVDSDDPRGVRSGALLGAGIAPTAHLDAFDQVENDWTSVDLLFFVDRSGSMGDDAVNLANNFGTFLDILAAGGIDHQTMVVTDDDGCTDFGILTAASPDPEGTFLAAVQGPAGFYTESGMIVVRNALAATDPGGCNAGFLRDGVTPVAVMVSDEPEQSPGGYATYLADMLAMVPDLVITAVVGQSGSPCAVDGVGYHEAAAATGGADLEICAADWGSYFYEIVGQIEPPLSSFPLSATPDPATLVVTVDGAAAGGWSYDAAENAVVFAQVSLPPPGSRIEVAYDEAIACP